MYFTEIIWHFFRLQSFWRCSWLPIYSFLWRKLRPYTQVRASKCKPCICYIQFSGIWWGCDAQECNWMCSHFHMTKRGNASHKKRQHPQIRLNASTFRVAEVFDLDAFLLFSFMDKLKKVLNTPSCLCLSSCSLPRHDVVHGPFGVQNVEQLVCFEQLGRVAPASFDPQLATRLMNQGICHQLLKIVLSPLNIEHHQNAFDSLIAFYY